MATRLLAVFVLLLFAVLSEGCTKTYSRQSVWQRYDFLTPVPQSSGLNVGQSSRIVPHHYQMYDNDDNYVIPYDYGFTGDRNNILGWNNMISK